MADLITQPYLTAALADAQLTAGQLARLPAMAASASALVRAWCNRQFTRAVRDEVYSVGLRKPVYLREFPVNAVLRLATTPTVVFSVQQTSGTYQRATASLLCTGSAADGLVVTGLRLTDVGSGVSRTFDLLFTASVTLNALAAAVAALNAGWRATVSSGYGLWPTADLRAVQGALPAKASAAGFRIHVDELPFELEPETGILAIGAEAGNDLDSPRWGPTLSSDFGDQAVTAAPNNVRVVYDAGFDTIPDAVQLACAELCKAQLDRIAADNALASETDGTYSWTGRAALEALPPHVLQALALYRVTGV